MINVYMGLFNRVHLIIGCQSKEKTELFNNFAQAPETILNHYFLTQDRIILFLKDND